ncbi:TrmH family RNA methyltransferase [Acidicapsa acidisoli]|uniref:TrmH family RNA methyltransferase n=1 Tax=Acidicapsa acidisoli TaxID=1615681 RepID=UPI0021E0F012|nr:RNA methyltransferase [Acidicapsa acidisoli]
MAIRIVQSKQNSRVKELRAALSRPGRGSAEVVALEGFHLVEEALRSGLTIETIFIAQNSERLLNELRILDSVEILALPEEVLASAVTTETSQPIAALARPQLWNWPDLLGHASSQTLIVILAGIQDPGNLGTILRSAEAFGATGAISLSGTVSHWNPKAMRASAGSVFRLPILSVSESDCFTHLRESSIQTLAAMAHEAQPLSKVDLVKSVALVIGAEGSGISDEIASQCDARITIPCPGPVESLNAGVAASILLYEASQQRTTRRARRKA